MTTSILTRHPLPYPILEPAEPDIEPVVTKVAAVMFPLDRMEAAALQAALGPSWVVDEGRKCENPELVIVRPGSMQTIAGLRQRFPGLTMIAIEPRQDDEPAAGLDHYAVGVGDLVADRSSRPCRRRSARWRHQVASSM